MRTVTTASMRPSPVRSANVGWAPTKPASDCSSWRTPAVVRASLTMRSSNRACACVCAGGADCAAGAAGSASAAARQGSHRARIARSWHGGPAGVYGCKRSFCALRRAHPTRSVAAEMPLPVTRTRYRPVPRSARSSAVSRGLIGAVCWRTPGLLRAVASSVTCWEVSVRFATTRLTGPAPNRRGEIDTRSVEIEPVTTIREGGRGSFLRCSVVPHAAAPSARTPTIVIAAARPVAPRISVDSSVPAPGAGGGRRLLHGSVQSTIGVGGDLLQRSLETVPGLAFGVLVLAALQLAQVVPVPRRGGLLGPGTVAVLSGGGRGHSCLLSGGVREGLYSGSRSQRAPRVRHGAVHAVRPESYICSRGPRSPPRDRGVPRRRHRDQRPRGRRVRAHRDRRRARRRRGAARPLGDARRRARAA